MGDLASRLEVIKYARELGVEPERIGYLTENDASDIRALREATSAALWARNERRVSTLAALTKLVPVAVSSKIAEHALGPTLSARVAGALDAADAVKLAGYLSPAFLAKVAAGIEPARVADIVKWLPPRVIVAVGTHLVQAADHVTLARFVAVIDPSVVGPVIDAATGHDLLQIALYADEREALDAIVEELPDERLVQVIEATADTGAYEAAVGLLASLSPHTCARLVRHVGIIPEQAREELIAAVAKHRAWSAVLPAMHLIEPATLSALVNVKATLDPEIIDDVLGHAYELDQAPSLVHLLLALDDEHVEALQRSDRARDAQIQDWLIQRSGVSRIIVGGVLNALGLRSER